MSSQIGIDAVLFDFRGTLFGAVGIGIQTYILPGPFRSGRREARGLDAVLRLVGIS